VPVWLFFLILLSPTTLPVANAAGARISRDRYGVPHIYADTVDELFRGWGYVVAQDRLWQLEVTRASVWGRVAELYGAGPDNRYLEYDRTLRQTYVPASDVEQEIQALPPEYQAMLQAYASGINKYIKAALADPSHKLPYEFHLHGVTPRTWTQADVAQVWIGSMALRYGDTSAELDLAEEVDYLVARHGPAVGAQIFDDLQPLEVPDSPVTCPGANQGRGDLNHEDTKTQKPGGPCRPEHPQAPGPGSGGVAEVAQRERARKELFASVLAELGLPARLGSSMWMAGGSRTSGALGLLVGGPQMGFSVPGYLHEVGLHVAGAQGFDLVGTTPVGYPTVMFGYNASIAWSATSGLGNVVDVYTLELVGDDTHYLHDEHVLAMDHRSEIIQVRDGQPVTVDVYRSIYGPVFDWQRSLRSTASAVAPGGGQGGGVAYTRRRAWEGLALQSWKGWVDMNRATTFDAFSQAAGSVALSMNWGYADKNDTIGYVHCGRYPIRPAGVDVRLPAPGSGEYDWQGFRPYSWNPKCLGQGTLANWNNRPAAGYPLGDQTVGQPWNSYQQVMAIDAELAARSRLTFNDMQAINKTMGTLHDEAAYFAPLWIGWLNGGLDPRQQEAVDRLEAWDHSYADGNGDGLYDSPALAIWNAWHAAAIDAAFLDELGTYTAPNATLTNLLLHVFQGDASAVPLSRDYLNGVPQDQVLEGALESALARLENQFGTPNMEAWLAQVEPHTFRTETYLGIPQAEVPVRDLHLKMIRGSETHIVALQPTKIKAVNINPPGESGFVAPNGAPSSHYADQLDLFEDYRGYKDMPLRSVGSPRPTVWGGGQ